MNKIIHIVEDDEDIRYIISYILTDMGYEVKLSETVADFHAQMKVSEPDLILLDVMLPDGNGLELCLELKQETETSHIPVIIMSAHATEYEVLRRSCAEDFIAKPFDLDDLLVLIAKHLPIENKRK